MDKKIIIVVALVIFAGFLFWGFQTGFFTKSSWLKGQIAIPEGIILFYGDGCPHCANVDNYISENSIKDKIIFSNLEVWNDENNQAILAQIVKKCGIDATQVGIPFLFDGVDKCYMGDTDVINYFKAKANIQ